ncbi:uncharacterized protein Eint_080990 [Encephalitozoon intestinalis ATCC 50506]|uniref:Uncharacterized protein n=1 Tax=Encephalitozoon intestinalis (strain ATCC 50506) TaxID=876142 RepID=E0S8P8_ENCIT|nr:uncharacterized protein Eint_080990 [Encephalitozoon intestinalis ATCC 50506]ADM12031.1 hypothetical protein Eint_080990 [Encephalitozoon intestinalis ATCC 50506]
MEFLKEFLEEWKNAIAGVKDRVMCEKMNVESGYEMKDLKNISNGGKGRDGYERDKENEEFLYDGDFDGSAFDQESLIPGHIPVIKSKDGGLGKRTSEESERNGMNGHPSVSCKKVSQGCKGGYKEISMRESPRIIDMDSREIYKGTRLKKPSVIGDFPSLLKKREMGEAQCNDAELENGIGRRLLELQQRASGTLMQIPN